MVFENQFCGWRLAASPTQRNHAGTAEEFSKEISWGDKLDNPVRNTR
jgi:hypothetical protein